MIFGQEVGELFRAFIFIAPSVKRLLPLSITENIEYIEIITEGFVFFGDGFNLRRYGRGTIFRHLPGEETICVPDLQEPYECLTVRFRINGEARRDYPRVSFWQDLKTLQSFPSEVLNKFHNPGFNRETLGAYVYSTLNWHSSLSMMDGNFEEIPESIRKAMDYLNDHTESHIPVENLAKMSKLSKPYFQMLFKKHMGTTPHKYHLNKRIGLACEALATEDKSIRRICSECGFDNIESFYRAFKRVTGTSPALYRQTHLNRF